MRRTTWLVAMGAALAVLAAQSVAAQNSQQAKMTTCNADAKAKGLKGADRQTFMKLLPASCGASLRPTRSGMWQLAQLAW